MAAGRHAAVNESVAAGAHHVPSKAHPICIPRRPFFHQLAPLLQAFAAYLNTNGIGHFYWTLNDNSFRTGSLFNDWTGASELKLAMLAASPATYMPVLESSWAEHWSSLLEAPPPSPPAVAPPFLFG